MINSPHSPFFFFFSQFDIRGKIFNMYLSLVWICRLMRTFFFFFFFFKWPTTVVELSSMCCDCKALTEKWSRWKRMRECIKSYVQRDVLLEGVIRWMNASMRSDLYDSCSVTWMANHVDLLCFSFFLFKRGLEIVKKRYFDNIQKHFSCLTFYKCLEMDSQLWNFMCDWVCLKLVSCLLFGAQLR